MSFSDNAWANQLLIIDWITKVFRVSLFKNAFRKLLIWDAYRCHISQETKDYLKRKNIDTAVLPGGTTSLLQAPDVSWNKPFKAKLRELDRFSVYLKYFVASFVENSSKIVQ